MSYTAFATASRDTTKDLDTTVADLLESFAMSVEAQAEAALKEITAISDVKDNAGLMLNAYRLGYIEGRVLDLTFGDGAFWSEIDAMTGPMGDGVRLEELITNDLYKGADYQADFRATPFASRSFDTVVFDPPYKLGGTPDSPDMDAAYGTDVARTRSEVHSLIVGGLAECSRITRKWVLVKVMDMVSSGQVRWQCDIVNDVLRALEMRKVDSLHLTGGRPQDPERGQVHARRNYSTLLVYKRGR